MHRLIPIGIAIVVLGCQPAPQQADAPASADLRSRSTTPIDVPAIRTPVESEPNQSQPINAVVEILPVPNKLGVTPHRLREKANSTGKGTFVYVPPFRVAGAERLVIWFVIDGKVFSLNGATKGSVTPNAPFPREDGSVDWSSTGHSQFTLTSAGIEQVYGR